MLALSDEALARQTRGASDPESLGLSCRISLACRERDTSLLYQCAEPEDRSAYTGGQPVRAANP